MDENNQGLQWSHIEPLCILRALARQLWMLLLAALTCAMAAWIVLTCFVTQQYTSSTTFSVTTRTSNLYYTNITAAADVAASYSQLLQSRVLRQTMEQDLGMPLNGAVSAQQLGETNLIRIAEKFQHEHAKGRRVFLFSSVSAAEGKSTLAANTAISLASRGMNVLFIDLDLRRPVQSEMLGLSVKQKNELGTLLTESAAPEKILSAAVTDPATGLHSLLSTKSYTDVIELLASDQLAKVVALARERYDYVIIDSPPLGFFSDSELLSDLSDASVLVVRQDTVPAPEINDAIDALRAGKAEFLGCILNDMAHLAAWSSGYGYGYGKKYDKYGYGQHSARKTQ